MKVRLSQGDAVIGLVLSGLGLWWLWMSWELGLGSVQEPGPGFFPAAISIALAGGGLGCAIRALRSPDPSAPRPWIEGPAAKAAGLIILLCILFTIGGFLLCAALFLFAMMVLVGNIKPLKSGAFALAITFVFWLVFERILSLQLPSGILFVS